MFEPTRTREFVLGPLGVDREMRDRFEDAHGKNALVGHVNSYITTSIKALLVGVNEPAYRLLTRARDWIMVAIEEGEKPRHYEPFADESQRFEWLALCKWLLLGEHDAHAVNSAAEMNDRYFEDRPDARHDTVTLDVTLPLYLDAGRCERVVELFETTRRIKMPENLRQVRTARQMAYVLCLQRARGVYEADEINACLRRFLSRHVRRSLNEGAYKDVAHWMKLAHWDGVQSRESAREALLHCYDYLPFSPPADDLDEEPGIQ